MCKLLGVSASGFYAWQEREPSKRAKRDKVLLAPIKKAYDESDGTYGAIRVFRELKSKRYKVGRGRVARLMRGAGMRGVTRRKRVFTTVRDPLAAVSKDLVKRKFTATRPNRLWVADATYVPLSGGRFTYLSMVLDVFSRRVVGWAMGERLTTELMVGALEMAVKQRRPKGEVVHHSDQGCQYTSWVFGKRCGALGVRMSMGTVGDAYDNAMAESFFATLECELLDRKPPFESHTAAHAAIFTFIEGWYNPRRRHSSLDYLSPAQFERRRAA